MNYYIGRLLTLGLDSNNNKFDKSVIEKLLNDQPKVPVRINFTGDPIGHTTLFRQDSQDDSVTVEFKADVSHLDELKIFVVPGGHCDIRDLETLPDGVRLIKKMTLTEVSITSSPTDPSITPFTSANIEYDSHEQQAF
jgi:hypothetical protein